MEHHVHVGSVHFITFFAMLYITNFTLRLWTSKHADNPIAKAISFGV